VVHADYTERAVKLTMKEQDNDFCSHCTVQ